MQIRISVVLAAIIAVAGCQSSDPASSTSSDVLQVVSGNGQTGIAGYRLANPVVIKITDGSGKPKAGATVTVTRLTAFGGVVPGQSTTDANGMTQFNWTLDGPLGVQTLTVTADSQSAGGIAVTATAVSGSFPIIAGSSELCALDTSGRLGCWGNPNQVAGQPQFVPAAGAPAFTALKMGGTSTPRGCALPASGRPWCFSVTGNGVIGGLAELGGSYPALVSLAGAGPTSNTFCGLTVDGQAFCWGDNSGGVQGTGAAPPQATPTAVATTARFIQLAVGDDEACGLTSDGKVWCWGDNLDFQVSGSAPSGTRVLPTLVDTTVRFSMVGVNTSVNGACAQALAGVYCWGLIPSANPPSRAHGSTDVPAPVLMFPGVHAAAMVGHMYGLLIIPLNAPPTNSGETGFRTAWTSGALLSSTPMTETSSVLCGPAASTSVTMCVTTSDLSADEFRDFSRDTGFLMGVPVH